MSSSTITSNNSIFLLLLLLCVAPSLFHVAAAEDDDYYAILGLEKERDEAAERDIKSAFRKLSKKYHPDLVGEAHRGYYQKIQRAYEVLGDRKKRKIYDIRGEEGVKAYEMPQQQQQHGGFPFFFGGGGSDKAAKRGANVNMIMLVTLEDIYNGAAHSVKLMKQKICRTCRGTGAASKEDFITCSQCGGSGVVTQMIQLMPGFQAQQQAPCPKCSGKGKMIGKKCPVCKGRRVTKGQHILGVDIEQGTPENFDLVYDMEGDQNPDEIPGDVIFTVSSAPHRVFHRRVNDLEASFNITLREALLGFTKHLKHLDGHDVELDEPGVVQYGQQRVLEGEGMPIHHVPSEHGKLTVTYRVILPERLTDEQRARLEKEF